MNDYELVKSGIADQLKKKEKVIRNENAIDAFFRACDSVGFPLGALQQVLKGKKDALEFERQKLTLDTILELVLKIDSKISTHSFPSNGIPLKILLQETITTQARPKIGILNRGKNTTMINNSFHGMDIGILDEGEDTFASGNTFEH